MSFLASPSVEAVRSAWGGELPDWVARLAEECARTSQGKTAGRLGYSPSVVSSVLKASYKGSLDAVEEKVRGVLMGATVMCPALGSLSTMSCREWRDRAAAFSGHNTLRVRMYRACSACPRNRAATQGAGDD
jgi:hypothetical protein